MHRVSVLTAALVVAGCQSHAGSEAARRSREMYGTSRPSFESGESAPDLSIAPALEEYVRFGLDESARLRAAFHRWRGAVESADIVCVALVARPLRIKRVGDVLIGTSPGSPEFEAAAREAADLAHSQAKPMDNIPGDALYRREMVPVYVRRTILAAGAGEGPVHHV